MCQNPGERSVLHPDYFNAYVKHYILPYFPSISHSFFLLPPPPESIITFP